DAIQGVLLATIPISVGVAVMKYRLYDIDLVIRKTVVFALLAAFIALVYAAIVGGVGAIVGETSNTTLAFAAGARPAVSVPHARHDAARRAAAASARSSGRPRTRRSRSRRPRSSRSRSNRRARPRGASRTGSSSAS